MTLAVLLLLLVLAPLRAVGQVPTVLGGVDVYRSTVLTTAWLQQHHGERLDVFVAGFRDGDMATVGRVYGELQRAVRQAADVAYLDLGITTSFEADTNRVYLMLDVVDRADSVGRLGRFSPAPRGSMDPPIAAIGQWHEYEQRALQLVQSRQLSPSVDSCPAHHCLLGFDHPELAPFRRIFDDAAREQRDLLMRAAREDSTAATRAAALFVLAHTDDLDALLDVIVPATHDPASAVRNNALRVLFEVARQHPDVELPLPAVLHALDDPASSVRNKAAVITAHVASRPAHRSAILAHGDAIMRLLRLQQANQHDPALLILQTLSRQTHAPRDYAAWESWLTSASSRSPHSPRSSP